MEIILWRQSEQQMKCGMLDGLLSVPGNPSIYPDRMIEEQIQPVPGFAVSIFIVMFNRLVA
jgi:hypothetical protein